MATLRASARFVRRQTDRLRPPQSQVSPGLAQAPRLKPARVLQAWLNMICVAIVFLGDTFVFALMWIPHSPGSKQTSTAEWYVVPVVAMGVVAVGVGYWLGLFVYRRRYRKDCVFLVDRKPKARYLDACKRDVLVSEWLEQVWLSPASGEVARVYLDRLRRQEKANRSVSVSSLLLWK